MCLLTLVKKKNFHRTIAWPFFAILTDSAHLMAGNVVQFIEPRANNVCLLSGFLPVFGAHLAS